MGESGSKPERSPFIQNFPQTHQLLHENFEDNRLGRVSIYKGTGENYVAIKKSFNQGNSGTVGHDSNIQQIINTLSQCPYVLKLLSYEDQDQQAMCGSVQQVDTYHEYFLNNLDAEIQQRNIQQLLYSESELWVILYSIIQASTFLEQYQKHINDIRPSNIFITPNGQLKLVPFGCYPDDFPGYNKTQTYNVHCYLAPEQLAEIQQGITRGSSNQQKADSFSIGMTLLTCATLQNAEECYDYDSFYVRNEAVDYFLQQAGQNYSRFLINIIKLLLEREPNQRPLPSAISKVLKPYENQILQLQQFTPNYEIVKQSINQSMQQERSGEYIQQQSQQITQIQQPSYINPQQNNYSKTEVVQKQENNYYQQSYQQQNSYQIDQQLNRQQGQQTQQQTYFPQQQQYQPSQQIQQQSLQQQPIQQYSQPQQSIGQQQQIYQSTYLPQTAQIIAQQPSPQKNQFYQQNQAQTQYILQEETQQYQDYYRQPAQTVAIHQQEQQYQQHRILPQPQYEQKVTSFQPQESEQQYQQYAVRIQPQPQYQEQVSSFQPQYNIQRFQKQDEVSYNSSECLNQSPIRLVQGPIQQQESVQQFQNSPVRPIQTAQYYQQPAQQPQVKTYTQSYTQNLTDRQSDPKFTQFQPPQYQQQVQLNYSQYLKPSQPPTQLQSQPSYQPHYQAQYQSQSNYQPQSQTQYQPQTGYDNNDLSDIDKRINEVLSRTKNAMERVEKQQNEYDQDMMNYQQ